MEIHNTSWYRLEDIVHHFPQVKVAFFDSIDFMYMYVFMSSIPKDCVAYLKFSENTNSYIKDLTHDKKQCFIYSDWFDKNGVKTIEHLLQWHDNQLQTLDIPLIATLKECAPDISTLNVDALNVDALKCPYEKEYIHAYIDLKYLLHSRYTCNDLFEILMHSEISDKLLDIMTVAEWMQDDMFYSTIFSSLSAGSIACLQPSTMTSESIRYKWYKVFLHNIEASDADLWVHDLSLPQSIVDEIRKEHVQESVECLKDTAEMYGDTELLDSLIAQVCREHVLGK